MAVGEKIGHGSVKSAACMNAAVVIVLDQGEKVGDLFVPAFLPVQPATPVLVSNVPSFFYRRVSQSRALPTREGGLPDQEDLVGV